MKKEKLLKKIKKTHLKCQSLGDSQDKLWERLRKKLDKEDFEEDIIDYVWDYVFNDFGHETIEDRLSKSLK